MVRNYRQMPLYEVIRDARLKSDRAKEFGKPTVAGPEEHRVQPATGPRGLETKWPRKPKLVQFNTGRVELSMPYGAALVAVLAVVLLALVSFRLGQGFGSTKEIDRPAGSGVQVSKKTLPLPHVDTSRITSRQERKPAEQLDRIEKPKMIEPIKNHRIVVKQYQLAADLVPVQNYFAQQGIGVEIEKRGNWYFLVTKERFGNTEKPGTDGYLAKQRIIRIGANYKAPSGYESFTFGDAYGEKVR